MQRRNSRRSPDDTYRRSRSQGRHVLRDEDRVRHPAPRASSRSRYEDHRGSYIKEIELKPPSRHENPLPLLRTSYGRPRSSSRARHACEERTQSRSRHERFRNSSDEHCRKSFRSSPTRQSRSSGKARDMPRSSSRFRHSSCRSSASSLSAAHQEVTKILDRRDSFGMHTQIPKHNRGNSDCMQHGRQEKLSRRSSDGLRRSSADSLSAKSLHLGNESLVSSILDKIASLNKSTSKRIPDESTSHISLDGDDSLFYPAEKETKVALFKLSDGGFNSSQTSTTVSTGASSVEEWRPVSPESNETINMEKMIGRPKFVAPQDEHHAPFASRTADHFNAELLARSTVLTIDQRPYRKSSSQPTPIKPSPPPPPRRSSIHMVQDAFLPSPPLKVIKSLRSNRHLNCPSTSLLGPGEPTGKATAFSRFAPPPPPPRKNAEGLLPLHPARDVKMPEPIQTSALTGIQTPEPIRAVSAGRGFNRSSSGPCSLADSTRPSSRERDFAPIDHKPTAPQEQPIAMLGEPRSIIPVEVEKEKKLLNRNHRVSRVENKAHVDQHGDAGVYTGEVNEDGLPHGKGKMKYDNGIYYEGKWSFGRQDSTIQRDRMLSGFTSWKGQPKNKQKGEKGGGCTVYGMDWIDFGGMAGKYTGDVNDENVPDGRGIMKYDFGLVAEGNWIKGVLNGGSQNGQMACGATVIPGGTVVPGGTIVQGGPVVGGGAMSVVSGLGMMSIGGTGATLAGSNMMNQYSQMSMNPNMYQNQLYGYNMPPRCSFQ